MRNLFLREALINQGYTKCSMKVAGPSFMKAIPIVFALWLCLSSTAIQADTAGQLDTRGIGYYKEGRFLEAAGVYEEALAQYPTDTLLSANAAVTFAKVCFLQVIEGGECAGMKYCDRACRLEPRSAQWFKILGRGATACGQDSNAVAAFRNALTLTPEDNEARWLLIQWYLRHDHPKEAMVQCDSLLKRTPTHAEALDLTVYLHGLTERYGEFGLRQTAHLILVYQPASPPSVEETQLLEKWAGTLMDSTFKRWKIEPVLQTLVLYPEEQKLEPIRELNRQIRKAYLYTHLSLAQLRDSPDDARTMFQLLMSRQVLEGQFPLGGSGWLIYGLACYQADLEKDLDLPGLALHQESDGAIPLTNLDRTFDPTWSDDFFRLACAKSFATVRYLDKFFLNGRWDRVFGTQTNYLDIATFGRIAGYKPTRLEEEVNRFIRLEYY